MSGRSACIVATTLGCASGEHTSHLHHHAPPHLCLLVLRGLLHVVSLRCLGLTIAVVLLLAFVERPSSLSLSSDPRRRSSPFAPPCGATESVELLCLLLFSLDLAVKVKAVGPCCCVVQVPGRRPHAR